MSNTTPVQTAQTRRILAHYRAADPTVVALGDAWYDQAQQTAQEIWPERPDLAAGVIAALSPRCQWVTNVAWARAVVHAARTGQECPAVHTTTMRAQAWRIANGEDPLSVLNGPKVRRFYLNISGDRSAVTVDVWAIRAALGADAAGDGRITKRQYDTAEAAYQRAAKIAGISPAAMQAIVWVQVRGRAA